MVARAARHEAAEEAAASQELEQRVGLPIRLVVGTIPPALRETVCKVVVAL